MMMDLNKKLADGGPLYAETPPDIDSAGCHCWVAEPFNTLSAALFILLAVYWLRRLWHKSGSRSFMMICLKLLLLGGIGGTLYHGTRASRFFFLLDVGPIFILASLATCWLWFRVLKSKTFLVGLLFAAVMLQGIIFSTFPHGAAINLSYALLALLVMLPMVLNIIADHGAGMRTVAAGVICFSIALFFRVMDGSSIAPAFPSGTHWLWHTFGCFAAAATIRYIDLLTTLNRAQKKESL